jgi:hypothetical protein
MGIKFLCPNGHKLHVKTFLSGKKAICPKCGARVVVPAETPATAALGSAGGARGDAMEGETLEATLVDSALAAMAPGPAVALETGHSPAGHAPPAAADAIAEAPAAVWYVRPASGGQYGPASGQIMRSWLEQGRVAANSLVWRDGWSEWRSAADVFPELSERLPAPTAAGRPPSIPAANGMPSLSAQLPLGHVVEGVPEITASINLPPSMPPLAEAVRKRRRKNDTRLIFSAVLGVVSLILVIVLVLVFRSQEAPSDPAPQEPAAADEEPMN